MHVRFWNLFNLYLICRNTYIKFKRIIYIYIYKRYTMVNYLLRFKELSTSWVRHIGQNEIISSSHESDWSKFSVYIFPRKFVGILLFILTSVPRCRFSRCILLDFWKMKRIRSAFFIVAQWIETCSPRNVRNIGHKSIVISKSDKWCMSIHNFRSTKNSFNLSKNPFNHCSRAKRARTILNKKSCFFFF